jgi:hypothetical protein
MIENDPVDSCRYRVNVRGEGLGQSAECRLIGEVSGVFDPSFCEVRRDACHYCTQSSPSGPTDLNPVLASILYGLTRTVIQRGGVDGCSTEQAAILQGRAEYFLDHDPVEVDTPYRPARFSRPCRHLGESIGVRLDSQGGQILRTVVSRCHHPDHRETTDVECLGCLDWSDRAGFDRDVIASSLPIPEQRCGPIVRSWSVGVTTSPRRRPTLEWTLDGLSRAGWQDPRIFMDGEVTIPHRHAGCPITYREPKLGAWPNFYLGLTELLLRDPEADAYLMVQDDVEFFDGVRLRDYLESILWPGDRPGPVSLYSCQVAAARESGWTFHESPWFLGAHAFVFPGGIARAFLVDPVVLAHRRNGPNEGLANIDTVVGEWASRHATPIGFPTPSLCRHVGHASTLWPGAKIEGNRKEGPYAGESG